MEHPRYADAPEALDRADHLVIKIGGENAARITENVRNARERLSTGQRLTLVVSALREERGGFNTTSALLEIADALARGDRAEALSKTEDIRAFTVATVRGDAEADETLAPEDRLRHADELERAVHAACDAFVRQLEHANGSAISVLGSERMLGQFSLTGWGEHLAQHVYRRAFQLRGVDSVRLPSGELAGDVYREDPLRALSEEQAKAAALNRLRGGVRSALRNARLSGATLAVGPGHFPLLATERGYSDTGAALVAQAAQDTAQRVVCLIRKVTPVREGDPRGMGEAPAVLRHLTFHRAREIMAPGGAASGVIHPQALAMLHAARIPTVVAPPQGERNHENTLIAD